MFTGKLFGGFIGFMVGGPFFAIIGILIGHFFDVYSQATSKIRYSRNGFNKNQNHIKQIFFEITFQTMGYIAKIDGRVSENDIKSAKDMMTTLDLNEEERAKAISMFNIGKSDSFSINAALANLIQACGNDRTLLNSFVEIQTQFSNFGGYISTNKRKVLNYISNRLGFANVNSAFLDNLFEFMSNFNKNNDFYTYSNGNWNYTHANFGRNNNYGKAGYNNKGSHNSSYSSYNFQPSAIENAYKILGVNKNSTQAEIKKAYRKLMNEHHPDRLIAKGMPQSTIDMATKKAQAIKSAYDILRDISNPI